MVQEVFAITSSKASSPRIQPLRSISPWNPTSQINHQTTWPRHTTFLTSRLSFKISSTLSLATIPASMGIYLEDGQSFDCSCNRAFTRATSYQASKCRPFRPWQNILMENVMPFWFTILPHQEYQVSSGHSAVIVLIQFIQPLLLLKFTPYFRSRQEVQHSLPIYLTHFYMSNILPLQQPRVIIPTSQCTLSSTCLLTTQMAVDRVWGRSSHCWTSFMQSSWSHSMGWPPTATLLQKHASNFTTPFPEQFCR